MAWTFECQSGGSGTSEFTFSGDSYEGVTKIKINKGPSGPMNMIQHIKAKRVGDC
jgi:hypothetical protein